MFNAFPILMQRRLRMFFLLFQILSVYQMTPNPLSIVTKMHAFFLLWLLAPQRQIETRKVLHINHVCQYNTLRLPHLTNRRDGWLTLQCQVRLVWSWALPMSQVPPSFLIQRRQQGEGELHSVITSRSTPRHFVAKQWREKESAGIFLFIAF